MPDHDQGTDRELASHEVEQAITVLYQRARARVKALADRFDPDLQPAGFGILRYIMASEPVRAGDIASALGLDKSAVSRQVATLRESGLVETRADPADARASLLVASAAAREALEGFREESKSDYDRIFSTWETDDIRSFARLLAQFNSNVPRD